MFLIMGISQGIKPITYSKTMICGRCGRYGSFEVTMTFMVFSLFFIPLIKWDKKFYVRTTCCGREYELDKEVGKRLLRGEDIEITKNDIYEADHNNYNHTQSSNFANDKICYKCGYKTNEEFYFCPKCGNKI